MEHEELDDLHAQSCQQDGACCTVVMPAQNDRTELVSTIQSLHRRGWCDGTGGNFSVVLDANPIRLLMAPSGVDKGRVTSDQFIEVNTQGNVVAGEGRASAETRLHLDIVQATGAGAVLHTHSVNATLLSRHHLEQGHLTLEGWEMLKGLDGITTHQASIQLPIVANQQNMQLLSQQILPSIAQAPHGFLVAGHGLYSWGATLREANRHVEILEYLLELHWRQTLLTLYA